MSSEALSAFEHNTKNSSLYLTSTINFSEKGTSWCSVNYAYTDNLTWAEYNLVLCFTIFSSIYTKYSAPLHLVLNSHAKRNRKCSLFLPTRKCSPLLSAELSITETSIIRWSFQDGVMTATEVICGPNIRCIRAILATCTREMSLL